MKLTLRRKAVNAVMLTLTGICTIVVAGTLLVILGYLGWNGARSLNLDFFTHLPAPVGEAGGGMANAILGSGKVLLLAVLMGAPSGSWGACTWPNLGRGPSPTSSAT